MLGDGAELEFVATCTYCMRELRGVERSQKTIVCSYLSREECRDGRDHHRSHTAPLSDKKRSSLMSQNLVTEGTPDPIGGTWPHTPLPTHARVSTHAYVYISSCLCRVLVLSQACSFFLHSISHTIDCQAKS
jgi:hypothetical protein